MEGMGKKAKRGKRRTDQTEGGGLYVCNCSFFCFLFCKSGCEGGRKRSVCVCVVRREVVFFFAVRFAFFVV